jgi:hypothetical protein
MWPCDKPCEQFKPCDQQMLIFYKRTRKQSAQSAHSVRRKWIESSGHLARCAVTTPRGRARSCGGWPVGSHATGNTAQIGDHDPSRPILTVSTWSCTKVWAEGFCLHLEHNQHVTMCLRACSHASPTGQHFRYMP